MGRLRALTETPILTHSSGAGPGALYFNASWEKQMLIHRACFAKQSPRCQGCTIVKKPTGAEARNQAPHPGQLRRSWSSLCCSGAEVFARHVRRNKHVELCLPSLQSSVLKRGFPSCLGVYQASSFNTKDSSFEDSSRSPLPVSCPHHRP